MFDFFTHMHNKKHRQVCCRLPSLSAFHIAININTKTYITELHFTRGPEVIMNPRSCLPNYFSLMLDLSSLYSYQCVPTSVNGTCVQFARERAFDICVSHVAIIYILHFSQVIFSL